MNEIPEAVRETAKAGGQVVSLLREFLAPGMERRLNNVRAEGLLDLAKAQVESEELLFRGRIRMAKEAAWEQKNLESIRDKAMPLLECVPSEMDEERRIDDDWFFRWSQSARKASDQDVQILWAKLLAKKFNGPNRFSLQSLNALSLFTHEDAEEFQKMCNFIWKDRSGNQFLLMSESAHCFLELKRGIDFRFLGRMVGLGLLRESLSTSLFFSQRRECVLTVQLQDQTYKFSKPKKNPVQVRLLTGAGIELLSLCAQTIDEEFIRETKDDFHGTANADRLKEIVPNLIERHLDDTEAELQRQIFELKRELQNMQARERYRD